jgi:hypothetical protein
MSQVEMPGRARRHLLHHVGGSQVIGVGHQNLFLLYGHVTLAESGIFRLCSQRLPIDGMIRASWMVRRLLEQEDSHALVLVSTQLG